MIRRINLNVPSEMIPEISLFLTSKTDSKQLTHVWKTSFGPAMMFAAAALLLCGIFLFPWVEAQCLLWKDLLLPQSVLIGLCLFLSDVLF